MSTAKTDGVVCHTRMMTSHLFEHFFQPFKFCKSILSKIHMMIMESTLGKLYFDTTTICAPQHIQALLFVGTIVVFGIIFVILCAVYAQLGGSYPPARTLTRPPPPDPAEACSMAAAPAIPFGAGASSRTPPSTAKTRLSMSISSRSAWIRSFAFT